MERQRGAADEGAEGGLEEEKEALFSSVLMLQEGECVSLSPDEPV